MNDELRDFIIQWADGDTEIRFLTGAGVIHGKLHQEQPGIPETILLGEAFYLSGGEKFDLGVTTIITNQVFGWGVAPLVYPFK